MFESQRFRSLIDCLASDPLVLEMSVAESKTSPLRFLLRRSKLSLSGRC